MTKKTSLDMETKKHLDRAGQKKLDREKKPPRPDLVLGTAE
jgi:hypothetical protein